jgi:hypothetical protein
MVGTHLLAVVAEALPEKVLALMVEDLMEVLVILIKATRYHLLVQHLVVATLIHQLI